MPIELIASQAFDAEELFEKYPPRFVSARKRLLIDQVTIPITGQIGVSRWRGSLPEQVSAPAAGRAVCEDGVFEYPPAMAGTTRWHVNFADAELFGFYGGSLFAQDEHQVLEHPILASVREVLLEHLIDGLLPRTRDRYPTPILIKGAQRCLFFDTVRGPYGNDFAFESEERLLRFMTLLDPPTRSNVVAMEAPKPGVGTYRRAEIRDALETAYIAFSACRASSAGTKTVVHTGNWGCGAFGGNRTLMALLQLMAAGLAGIDLLVFHSMSPTGRDAFGQGQELYVQETATESLDVEGFVERVYGMGFEWGMSDGN